MKKQYESPLAEKYEFDYLENVVASGLVTEASATDDISPVIPSNPDTSVMDGRSDNGCYSGANAKKGCTLKY